MMSLNTSFGQPKQSGEKTEIEIRAIQPVLEHVKAGRISLATSIEVELELLFLPIRQSPDNELNQLPKETLPSPTALVSNRVSGFSENEWTKVMEERWNPMSGFDASVDTTEQIYHILYWLMQMYARDRSMTYILNFQTLLAKYRCADRKVPTAAELLMPVFEEIQTPRYAELSAQMQSEAPNGVQKPNQYMDAYLLWTAEMGDCDYFLTCDAGILSNYDNSAMQSVSPTALLKTVESIAVD